MSLCKSNKGVIRYRPESSDNKGGKGKSKVHSYPCQLRVKAMSRKGECAIRTSATWGMR